MKNSISTARQILMSARRPDRQRFWHGLLASSIALVTFLLLSVNSLYGQSDALFIDNSGNVGIGTNTPGFPLSFPNELGDKISLYGQSGNNFGLGIQGALLQIHTNDNNSDIAFGYGKSDSLTETMRIKGNGNVGIGTNDPQYALQISNFAPGDRYIALTTGGGNKYKTGIKLWAWQKDYGFTIEHDEAKAGLNILRNYADGIKPDPVGKTAFFISTTSGNVGIATTEPSLPLDVNGWIGSSSKDQTRDGWRLGRWPGNNAGNEWVYLSNSSGASYQNLAVGNLYVSGTITYKGKNLVFNNRFIPTAENLEAESDLRLKTDLNQIPNALERLKKLRGFTYRWNETGLRYFTRDIEHTLSAGPNATSGENRKLWQKERDKRCKELSRTNVGVIAQEVEAVLPEAVTTDESGYKSVNYYELIPLVIEALKEEDGISKGQSETIARQQAEIQRLTAASELALRQLNELREVKQKLARLEAAMSKLAGSGSSGDHNELISSAEGSKSNPGNTLDSH